MTKKKISKKQELTWNTISITNINPARLAGLKEVRPVDFFKNYVKVGATLLECLLANDTEAFLEILNAFLKVNRSGVAKKVQHAFFKSGNPTLKTIAKIVHYEASPTHDTRRGTIQKK